MKGVIPESVVSEERLKEIYDVSDDDDYDILFEFVVTKYDPVDRHEIHEPLDDNILTIKSHSHNIKFLHMFKYFLISLCVLMFGFASWYLIYDMNSYFTRFGMTGFLISFGFYVIYLMIKDYKCPLTLDENYIEL